MSKLDINLLNKFYIAKYMFLIFEFSIIQIICGKDYFLFLNDTGTVPKDNLYQTLFLFFHVNPLCGKSKLQLLLICYVIIASCIRKYIRKLLYATRQNPNLTELMLF